MFHVILGFEPVVVKLIQSLAAWGTPDFKTVLKQELCQLGNAELPLQRGLTSGSVALDDDIEAMIIATFETKTNIQAKVGIFYQSIIAGCACSDDPTPSDICNEYCEVQLEIFKTNAETTISLL